MLAVELFDPGALAGILSLITIPVAAIATAWAVSKTGQVKAEQANAQAEREGREAAAARLRLANEWNAELEKQAAKFHAQRDEKDHQIQALHDRISAQKEHMDKLLERTPEKLWEAVERHAAAASEQWEGERLDTRKRWAVIAEMQERLDSILDRLEAIDSRLGPQ